MEGGRRGRNRWVGGGEERGEIGWWVEGRWGCLSLGAEVGAGEVV